MHEFKKIDDTIAAISTPVGQGGIGVIRLSGPLSLSIAQKIFVSKNKKETDSFKNFTVHYGWIVDKQNSDDIIDEVLLTLMRSPHSYTAEDVVEISCHGGIVSLKAILELVLRHGARLAEPGEFTKRAFLNGRMDLAQAEAVLDIIQSKTDAFLRVSTHQLKGELSTELENIREILMDVYTEIEAYVNFPEDEINEQAQGVLVDKIRQANGRITRLLSSSEHGRILKEGITVVLCGKTNVGKSSLLNAFLKTPRAIVSDIAGTTRDTIEETAQIKGIPFQIIDTAGFLTPSDSIEEEAIRRSRLSVEKADLILFLLDISQQLTQEDYALMESVKQKNVLVVLNKSDLKPQWDEKNIADLFCGQDILKISALKKEGIQDLEEKIVEKVWHGQVIDTHGILVSNLRHIESLKCAQTSLLKAQDIFKQGISLEFISEEIKESVHFLDEITGRNIDIDLLDKIFTQFCIGK
ncbi:MAG: tRNA uridine-5-carboxymethylaminomethyl(34) synthesis GTPase MnmE [Candidatus Omnitrophica bacterium]|nr:tRNA uridine-5-carboxymethylaminomethyl(34) synthesis GTPase MnmE [Candidatus Omnitrophota bacterium]